MTRIAKKKGVDNKAGYVVKPIAVKDIEKQADFGTFKITRTRDCIAYTNYVGYSVITKPYTTTPEGKATELSLYAWLNYALEQKEYLGGDDEVIEAVNDMTDEDVEHSLLEIAINSQYAGESIAKTHDAILEAVGVEPKSTIQFEKDGDVADNTESDTESDTENESETTEVLEPKSDEVTDATEAVEPKEAEEEKPRNKGGRPRGSKNKSK